MRLVCRQDKLTVTLVCDFITKCVNVTVVTTTIQVKCTKVLNLAAVSSVDLYCRVQCACTFNIPQA